MTHSRAPEHLTRPPRRTETVRLRVAHIPVVLTLIGDPSRYEGLAWAGGYPDTKTCTVALIRRALDAERTRPATVVDREQVS